MTSEPTLTEDDIIRKTERITDWKHKILINGNIVSEEDSPKLIQQILQALQLEKAVREIDWEEILLNLSCDYCGLQKCSDCARVSEPIKNLQQLLGDKK